MAEHLKPHRVFPSQHVVEQEVIGKLVTFLLVNFDHVISKLGLWLRKNFSFFLFVIAFLVDLK